MVVVVLFLTVGLVLVAFPAPCPQTVVVQNLDDCLDPGAVVGVDRNSRVSVLPYVPRPTWPWCPPWRRAGGLHTLLGRGRVPLFVRATSVRTGEVFGESFACTL